MPVWPDERDLFFYLCLRACHVLIECAAVMSDLVLSCRVLPCFVFAMSGSINERKKSSTKTNAGRGEDIS